MNASIYIPEVPIVVIVATAVGVFLTAVYVTLRNPTALEMRFQRFSHPRTLFWMVTTAVFLSLLGILGTHSLAQWQGVIANSETAVMQQANSTATIALSTETPAFWQTNDTAEMVPGIAVITTQYTPENADLVIAGAAGSQVQSAQSQAQTAVASWMTPNRSDMLFIALSTLSFLPIGLVTLFLLGLMIAARSMPATENRRFTRDGFFSAILCDRFANSLMAVTAVMALGILLSLGIV